MSAPSQTRKAARQPLAGGDDRSPATARNSVLFRAVNEQIRLVAEGLGVTNELELMCECERGNCLAHLSVALDEYEGVRRFPTRFLTKPQHVSGDERIVKDTGSYVVVEKVGHAARSAILLDPRRHTDHHALR